MHALNLFQLQPVGLHDSFPCDELHLVLGHTKWFEISSLKKGNGLIIRSACVCCSIHKSGVDLYSVVAPSIVSAAWLIR